MFRLTWDAIRRSLGVPEQGDMEAADEGPVDVAANPAGDERVTITYSGALAKRGAQAIYLHYGLGPGEWRDVRETAMRPVAPGRFQATVDLPSNGRLEFCFRDERGHWDNNGGRNWSYAGEPAVASTYKK